MDWYWIALMIVYGIGALWAFGYCFANIEEMYQGYQGDFYTYLFITLMYMAIWPFIAIAAFFGSRKRN